MKPWLYPIPNLTKLNPRTFEFSDDTQVLDFKVPKGFVTDGASVPRLFWWFISPFGKAFPAAIIHDYKCIEAETIEERVAADKEFYRNLKFCGVSFFRRVCAYYAVRTWSELRRTWLFRKRK